jgi:hypothetical protein
LLQLFRNWGARLFHQPMGHGGGDRPPGGPLVSEEAGFITGTNIVIDGGWTVR